ncbi:MAG TPA: AAA family ATPase [Longimicrobiales bacterium]|nr:AAA family ATPase [Longimicrobiales bacterium]
MRILRISTPAFGGLRELDTGPDPLPGLVVVEGRNEAGKSTFFELVTTLLYGFYPAARESHPYAPWDGGVPEARGVIRLRDGTDREVQRRLLSSPQGSLVTGGVEEQLRNRTLPFVEHVPQPVFRHVFALTLAELAGLEGESWEGVQDRLLGAMGASDLRSAREVVDELEGEAGKLWRTTRRGSQEVRDLEERLKELRLRRHDVAAQEADVRRISAELADARQQLETAREEREACRVYVERYRALLPIREQLLRVEGLLEDAGDPAVLEGIPGAPRQRLEELRDREETLSRGVADLEKAMEEPRDTIRAFTPGDQGVLQAEAGIEALVAGQAGLEPTRVRIAQLDQELRDLERRLDAGTRRLLDRGLDAEFRGRLLDFPLSPLQEAIRALDEARSNLAGLSHTRRESDPPREEALLWLPVGVLAAGIAALLLSSQVGGATLAMAGTVCLGAGLVLTYHWYQTRSRLEGEDRAREERARDLERLLTEREGAVHAAETRLAELLAPLNPGPALPDPGADFTPQVERLQDLVRDEKDRRRALAEAHREVEAVGAAAAPLRTLLAVQDRGADLPTLAHLLSRTLRAAVTRRDAAEAARRELQRLEQQLAAAREDRGRVQADLAALSERLAALGDGMVGAGADRAEARMEAAARARQIMEELEFAHPHLEEIRERIAAAEARGEDWAVDADAVAQRRAREESLSGEIEELLRAIQGHEKDLQHLRERTTLDELDGEILAVEEKIRELSRHRDRLWILGRVVREAERQLREEHQPAILQEAGRLLARLTDGRYDRLVLAGRDGRSFRVRGPAVPTPLAIERPLSAGTREQIYLALRLAILDQLDRAGERLPLLLDEVLVNWDPSRREAGLAVLEEISRDRQCLFFTCHPGMAERLEGLGGRRIVLGGP